MSEYPPPNEILPIFDSNNFHRYGSGTLTKQEADLLYLHFPIGQGTETIPDLFVSNDTTIGGDCEVGGDIVLSGVALTNFLEFPDGTKQYTASSSTALLSTNNTWTGTQTWTGVGTFNNQAKIIWDNGNTSTPSFAVADTAGNGIAIFPNANNDSFNPIVENNDNVIFAGDNVANQNILVLTNWSAYPNGVRLTNSATTIGCGAINQPTLTNRMVFDGLNNNITITAPVGAYFDADTYIRNKTLVLTATSNSIERQTNINMYADPLNGNPNVLEINNLTEANNNPRIDFKTFLTGGIGSGTTIIPLSIRNTGIKLTGTAPITFPDNSVQTTAFTGVGATPNLSAVLTAGNNAGFQDINQVSGIGLQDYTSIVSFGPPAIATSVYSALGITALNGGTISAVNGLMETQSVNITGGNGVPYVDIIVTLGNNVYADTTYSVFYSWYYGYTGSGGTWNAKDTANALGNGIVYSKTASQFQFYCSKGQGNNINAYLNFQIVYNPLGGSPAVYS
jgi:hypothetical protein